MSAKTQVEGGVSSPPSTSVPLKLELTKSSLGALARTRARSWRGEPESGRPWRVIRQGKGRQPPVLLKHGQLSVAVSTAELNASGPPGGLALGTSTERLCQGYPAVFPC